jgi:transcriptional regulator with XRE-family HTH domain
MKFTEFIKKRRDILRFTQEDLARRLGTTTAYVGLIEGGHRCPKKVTSLEKLRIALDIEEKDSGWFARFSTYGEKPELCNKYLRPRVLYQEPDSGESIVTEDSPVYQAFSDVVKQPSVDQDQLLQVLTVMQNPKHPLHQMIVLLLDQPPEVIATLLHRVQFELQLIERPPKKDS